MRRKKQIEGILLHISVICSLVCMIMKVLDWYNPYMDFIGHASFAEYTLYASVIVLAVSECSGRKKDRTAEVDV